MDLLANGGAIGLGLRGGEAAAKLLQLHSAGAPACNLTLTFNPSHTVPGRFKAELELLSESSSVPDAHSIRDVEVRDAASLLKLVQGADVIATG
jgi:hypothetical protein